MIYYVCDHFDDGCDCSGRLYEPHVLKPQHEYRTSGFTCAGRSRYCKLLPIEDPDLDALYVCNSVKKVSDRGLQCKCIGKLQVPMPLRSVMKFAAYSELLKGVGLKCSALNQDIKMIPVIGKKRAKREKREEDEVFMRLGIII